MIEEQIAALIQALSANTAALSARSTSGDVSSLGPAGSVGPATAALAAPVPANITADSITALIQPHLDNAPLKTELGVAMRSMGINALPEIQPHQFSQVYAAFQGVLAKYGIGGAAPTPAPVATSII